MTINHDESILMGLYRESDVCNTLEENEKLRKKELIFENFQDSENVKFKVIEDHLDDQVQWKVFNEQGEELTYIELLSFFTLANLKRQVKERCQA
jgi:hypothetical protein